jgi:hypothetical protein
MPTISMFYGIVIRMFFNDHAPPHFHARYGEFEATIEIGSGKVLQGQLPTRALDLATEWAASHQIELLENWQRCRDNRSPAKIDPLV